MKLFFVTVMTRNISLSVERTLLRRSSLCSCAFKKEAFPHILATFCYYCHYLCDLYLNIGNLVAVNIAKIQTADLRSESPNFPNCTKYYQCFKIILRQGRFGSLAGRFGSLGREIWLSPVIQATWEARAVEWLEAECPQQKSEGL
jgi:hypothetical protein